MAYEADAHKSIYPDLPIIWLDELSDKERIRYINNLVQIKISNYIGINIDVKKDRLEQISRILWNDNEESLRPGRDEKFFNKICKAGYSNVFVLVGARHANPEIEDNLYNRLLDAGYNVKVFILDMAFTENSLINL